MSDVITDILTNQGARDQQAVDALLQSRATQAGPWLNVLHK